MLEIVSAPHKALETPARQIITVDGKIRRLIRDMEETLASCIDPQGVGLAAPQIGVSLAVFIIKPTPKSKTEVFINPQIISTSGKKVPVRSARKKPKASSSLEGCLSIPRIWGRVNRSPSLTVSYLDEMGVEYTKDFSRLKAIIIQHEVDHLAGVLFTKRTLEQGGSLYEEVEGKLKPLKY